MPPRKTEKPGSRSPRRYRVNTAASGSGQLTESIRRTLYQILAYIVFDLGVWSMYRGTREPILRRSRFLAAGLAVGKHLVDG